MNYKWINPEEVVGLDGLKLVLFGAGKGYEEFLHYMRESNLNIRISAIADNDPSFWRKRLDGYKIIAPEQLKHTGFDRIVVTSVSGREAIALQLEEMGFGYDKDYILIGRYPQNYIQNFDILSNELPQSFSLEGAHCLHIGPGGFLGLEVLLYCFGAEYVCSIDKFTFGVHFPDISKYREDYIRVKGAFENESIDEGTKNKALRRFEEVFIERNDRFYIDNNKIDLIYPMDVCGLSFDAESFDLVLSFTVLEHVIDPGSALTEIARVLKPGGLTLHTICTRDHRSFSKMAGYTPFSFRYYSFEEWEEIVRKKFYQNRCLPIEWYRFFQNSGLRIQKYIVGSQLDIDDQTLTSFHADFKKFSRKELGEIDCEIMAKKQDV